jgi:hypothetical protein
MVRFRYGRAAACRLRSHSLGRRGRLDDATPHLRARPALWALAAILLLTPVLAQGSVRAGPEPANRIAVYFSGLRVWDRDPRETYGTVPGAGLALSHALTPQASASLAVGYARRTGDPYNDRTFEGTRAATLTLVPIALGLRARPARAGSFHLVYGLDLLAGLVEERHPAVLPDRGTREMRDHAALFGLRVSFGPEVSLPRDGLRIAFEMSLEDYFNAGRHYGDWSLDPSGISGRLTLSAPL